MTPKTFSLLLALPLVACSAATDFYDPNDGAQIPGAGGDNAGTSTGTSTGDWNLVVEDPVDCEAPSLLLTVRDFNASHPDMETYTGANEIGCGMVAPTLGEDGKPVFVSGYGTEKRRLTQVNGNLAFDGCEPWNGWTPAPVISSQSSFDQWYRDVDGVNTPVMVQVDLLPDDSGNFVYDNPAFFPVDGLGFGEITQGRNFHFTTEAHVEFTYVGGETFTFRGDDDLWIFVNGRLAVDLGGPHMPIESTIDFDAQAAELGIKVGGTYQMDIFHAERHTHESNFRVETNIACLKDVTVK